MRSSGLVKPIVIAEDNDDDYEVVYHALTDAGGPLREIIRCENGQDLLDYLRGKGQFSTSERSFPPAFIILDLNLPGIDGRAVLQEIKSDRILKKIPVVVMTVSNDQRDVESCYEAGANTFIAKPIDWNEFFSTVARMKEYWLKVAILPEGDA